MISLHVPLCPRWLIFNREVDLAMQNLFEGDARRLVLLRVYVYARVRAALQLFAAFGGENDEAIFRIYLRLLRLFCDVRDLFCCFNHKLLYLP
jgi:hypothetical protein